MIKNTEVKVIQKENLYTTKNADLIEQQLRASEFLNLLAELHFKKDIKNFQERKDVAA